MTTPINLQLLVVFCAVAEHKSFSKAAKELCVAKGTVSRSIALLESQLEVELIHRTTHQVSLSTAGIELYERTRTPLAALRSAVQEMPELDEEPSGLLRITVPHDFGTIVMPSLISTFSRRHPAVRFDVRHTGEHVDLVKEGYDIAIRASMGQLKDSTLTVRRLVRDSAAFYAAPSYIARRGKTRRLDDPSHDWIFHPSVPLAQKSKTPAKFLVDDFQTARDLAIDGAGIVLLPKFVARDPVRQGLLEKVSIPGVQKVEGDIVMLYPSSGQLSRKVTSFRDFLIEALKTGVS